MGAELKIIVKYVNFSLENYFLLCHDCLKLLYTIGISGDMSFL